MKDFIFADNLIVGDEPFDFERALMGGDYFFEKTSIIKKAYQKFLEVCNQYPNDPKIEEVRQSFRQALNSVECAEMSMQEIYKLCLEGKIPNEVLPPFVGLLKHWQGKHFELRDFRQHIQKLNPEKDFS